MKRLFILLTALLAFGFVSCQKESKSSEEIVNPETGMKKVSITATAEGTTKTSYNSEGVFSWLEGDQISVRCSDNNYYTFTAEATGSSTTFTGEIPVGYEISNRAYYPADENISGELGFYLATEKDMTDHPSAEIPMIGISNGSGFAFQHMCGAFELVVDNIPDEYESVKIDFVSDRRLLSTSLWVSSYSESDVTRYRTGTNESTEMALDKRTFSRKVVVSNNKALVYVPYSGGKTLNGTNTVTVTGYPESGVPVVLAEKSMKNEIGLVERAKIITSETPLIISQLGKIDWSDVENGASSEGNYLAFKALIDDYYVYLYSKRKNNHADIEYYYYGIGTLKESPEELIYNEVHFDGSDVVFHIAPFDGDATVDRNGTLSALRHYPPKGNISTSYKTKYDSDSNTIETEIAILKTSALISSDTGLKFISYGNKSADRLEFTIPAE